MKIRVRINVMAGVIEGSTWCSISWTRPDVIETDTERTGNKRVDFPEEIIVFQIWCVLFIPAIAKALSRILYNAQIFGAQYAWQSPRLKGNNRERTCGNWFYRKKFSIPFCSSKMILPLKRMDQTKARMESMSLFPKASNWSQNVLNSNLK